MEDVDVADKRNKTMVHNAEHVLDSSGLPRILFIEICGFAAPDKYLAGLPKPI